MCLMVFNWQPHAPVRLIIASNRDEYYARPTQALGRWPDQPIIAGRDLQAGGTWLGMSLNGRVAVLTNYREPTQPRLDSPSRGQIASAFLASHARAQHFLEDLLSTSQDYNPFNLLLFDGTELVGFESRHRHIFLLPKGVSAVSNGDFNDSWPKLNRLRCGFSQALSQHDVADASAGEWSGTSWLEQAAFTLLSERRTAAPADLPQTGIPFERELSLSAEFVHSADYGTRASTVVCVGGKSARITERSFNAEGFCGEVSMQVDWNTFS